MITKKLIQSEDCYVQFTDEEMSQLNIQPGDKFNVKHHDDGSILLEKFVPIDIYLEEFDKETLIHLIKMSIENDCTVSETINDILKEVIQQNEFLKE